MICSISQGKGIQNVKPFPGVSSCKPLTLGKGKMTTRDSYARRCVHTHEHTLRHTLTHTFTHSHTFFRSVGKEHSLMAFSFTESHMMRSALVSGRKKPDFISRTSRMFPVPSISKNYRSRRDFPSHISHIPLLPLSQPWIVLNP